MKFTLRATRLREQARYTFYRWIHLWQRRTAAPDHVVILFFNDMWGQLPDYPADEIPDGCVITIDKQRMREATVVVFHIPSLISLHGVEKYPGQVWVAWSMECEVHYPQLVDPDFMSQFDLTMTYHRDADVVTPYYSSCFEHRPAKAPKTQDKLAAFFASSHIDRSGRIKYVAELMRYIDVHSYGRQLRNKRLPQDRGRATKLDTIAAYKFTFAFENAIAPDYVTEKFFDPLLVGSVPVYLGAPNAAEFAPGEHCYIDAADFKNPRALAEYLLDLNADDAAYQKYLAWTQRPLRPGFLALLEGQRLHPFSRLCQKIRELKARQCA